MIFYAIVAAVCSIVALMLFVLAVVVYRNAHRLSLDTIVRHVNAHSRQCRKVVLRNGYAPVVPSFDSGGPPLGGPQHIVRCARYQGHAGDCLIRPGDVLAAGYLLPPF